jgi:hypothetical protein
LFHPFPHGLRASELIDLQWTPSRLRGRDAGGHPRQARHPSDASADRLRALRRLHRESVFFDRLGKPTTGRLSKDHHQQHCPDPRHSLTAAQTPVFFDL